MLFVARTVMQQREGEFGAERICVITGWCLNLDLWYLRKFACWRTKQIEQTNLELSKHNL